MTDPVIRFEKLDKRFGRVAALRAIDLEVPHGAVFGFLGPNGAGKSTALRILLDLIRPTSGRAHALGLDAQRDGVALRARIGYLPGELRPEPRLTADEQFDLVAAIRGNVDERYRRELTERLQLDPSRRIGELSRGNRQKVGLVMAFMSRPELLVLDEPTGGLDPLLQEEVHGLLRETVADGRSVFFSSHVLSEVQEVCTRVAMLRAGEIVDVFDLAERRRLAPERLTVEFAEAPPPGAFDQIERVRVIAQNAQSVEFELTDSADALVKRLAAFTVVRLVPREVSLDELFLSYYEPAAADPPAAREAIDAGTA